MLDRTPIATRAKRAPKPKHRVETRAYAFPLDCSVRDAVRLNQTASLCWELRNFFAMERKGNRLAMHDGRATEWVSKGDQYKTCSRLAKSDQRFSGLHSQVMQNVADRIDEGYKRWFDALKKGQHHIQPPSLIARKRYQSFTYTQYGTGAHIKNGRLHLSKLGSFKINAYRKIRGKKKSVTVKFKDGSWWAIVTAEIQAADLYLPMDNTLPDAGFDPGLKKVMTDSAGNQYKTPKPLKAAGAQLKRESRIMSRKFEARKTAARKAAVPVRDIPYSNRLLRQIKKVAKCHTKVVRTRDHFAKKNAAIAASRFRRVAVEEHGIKFMFANRRTAKTAADVSIAAQKFALQSKLGSARYTLVANRRAGIGGNSQTCLCGEPVPKTLNNRWHQCPACGLEGERDWMSANIVQYSAFGTVHESVIGACVLGEALTRLARRGEVKSGRKETCTREVPAREATETSAKRRSLVSGMAKNTRCAEASREGNTLKHRNGQPIVLCVDQCAETLPVAPSIDVVSRSPHF
jgi:transposase